MTEGALQLAPRGRSRRGGVLLGLVLLFAVRPGPAEAARVVAPAGGETLVAGQLVAVRWNVLPADVDEMELLLDVDETAELHLRLTPQLAAPSRSYLWRVPNLPGRNARLRLRWGHDGVEVEGEPSAPFAILANLDAPFDSVRFRSGEWWLADPLSTFEPPRSGLGRVLDGRFERPQPATTSVVTEVSPGATVGRQQRTPSLERQLGVGEGGHPHAASRCPLTIPLRP